MHYLTEWILTRVGDTSSPAQTVKTDWGALREAVGLEGHPLEHPNGPQCDSSISLREQEGLVSVKDIEKLEIHKQKK